MYSFFEEKKILLDISNIMMYWNEVYWNYSDKKIFQDWLGDSSYSTRSFCGRLFISQLILIMIINWNDRRRVIHASLVLLPGEFVYRVGAVLNQPIVNNDYVLFRPVNYLLRVHRADRGVICMYSMLSRKD